MRLDEQTLTKLKELSAKLNKTQAELVQLAVAQLARRTHHNGDRWYVER